MEAQNRTPIRTQTHVAARPPYQPDSHQPQDTEQSRKPAGNHGHRPSQPLPTSCTITPTVHRRQPVQPAPANAACLGCTAEYQLVANYKPVGSDNQRGGFKQTNTHRHCRRWSQVQLWCTTPRLNIRYIRNTDGPFPGNRTKVRPHIPHSVWCSQPSRRTQDATIRRSQLSKRSPHGTS